MVNIWKNKHQFDEVAIMQEEQYYYVVEHNDLITKARHDLTARELKIMDYIISRIRPDDAEFTVIKASLNDICSILGLSHSGKTYTELTKNLGSLRKKEVYIYNAKEKSITLTGWLERAKVWNSGQIELKINEDFAPYLLNLRLNGHYTQHLLLDSIKLKSRYSILLNKLMRETSKFESKPGLKRKFPILEGTPEYFKDILNAPKSYTYGRLKDNILKPAIKQINLYLDDMDLAIVAEKKQGRSIKSITIRNEWVPKRTSKKGPKIPEHNWVQE